jgi:hypothetical protein
LDNKLIKEDDRPRLPIPRTGRKTLLTEELVEGICRELMAGAPITTACIAAGVKDRTFRSWMQKAEADEFSGVEYDESPHMILADRVRHAYAMGELELLREMRDGDKGWQAKAWILERTRFSQYGLKQDVSITVDMKGPSLPPDPPRDHKEWVERKIARDKLQQDAMDAEFEEVEDGRQASE